MGFSDSTKCRKHSNKRNLPGVCSSCLREKLSKLSTTPYFYNGSFLGSHVSGSSSPPYLSTSSAPRAAVGGGKHHRRNASEAYVSISMVMNDGLKMSRSMSCALFSKDSRRGYNGNFSDFKNGDTFVDNSMKLVEENGKKKEGFLKRFFSIRKGGLLHSKAMKERSHTSSNYISSM